jgi:hypothetical protein
MISYLASSISAFALTTVVIVVVGGILVFYALHSKGDVFAELTHGNTTLRLNARDRRDSK